MCSWWSLSAVMLIVRGFTIGCTSCCVSCIHQPCVSCESWMRCKYISVPVMAPFSFSTVVLCWSLVFSSHFHVSVSLAFYLMEVLDACVMQSKMVSLVIWLTRTHTHSQKKKIALSLCRYIWSKAALTPCHTLVPVLACMPVLAYLCNIFRRYSRVTTEHGIPIVLKDRFAEKFM